MQQSLYDVLGVSRTATEAELKKAYRKLARTHHPDVNPGDPRAEELFKRIGAAWDILGDPEKRRLYDEFGEDATQVGFDPEQARAHKRWQEQAQWRTGGQRARSMDMDAELYESLFGRRAAGQDGPGGARRGGPGGGRGGGRARSRRGGHDFHAELTTDFRTAALGGVRSLSFSDGSTLDVRIPPGVDDGGSIRLRGKGGSGVSGGPDGDLVITLRVEPDPVFTRDGLDLHIDLPITVVEAVRGARIDVPTLDGRVTLTVPAGAQTGSTLRLKGRGIQRKDRAAGHLFAHLQVRAPDGPVDDAILEALQAAYRTDVRATLDQVQR